MKKKQKQKLKNVSNASNRGGGRSARSRQYILITLVDTNETQNLQAASEAPIPIDNNKGQISEVSEVRDHENLQAALNAPIQIANNEGQVLEVSKVKDLEKVRIDGIDIPTDWRNYTFSEQKWEFKLSFRLCDIPHFWRVPVEQLINYIKVMNDGRNKKYRPFKEIRFVCKVLTDYMRKFRKDHKSEAFTMRKIMPFLIEMIYASKKSESNEQDDSLATTEAKIEFIIEWIRPEQLCYKGISSKRQKTKDKDDKLIVAAAHEDERTSSELIVITSRIKESTLNSDGMSSEVFSEESTTTVAKKQFESIEANDEEVPSTSGISQEVAHKMKEMDPKVLAQMQAEKANMAQNIIKCMVTTGDSVQVTNRLAFKAAKFMLQNIYEKKQKGQEMKSKNLLTDEQSKFFEHEFNSYIRFIDYILEYMTNLIQQIDKIIAYMKLNLGKILPGNHEALEHLIDFENRLCGHLVNFHKIARVSLKAREICEEAKEGQLPISDTPESVEYESMFVQNLFNFASLSQTLDLAWDASDAFLEILQSLVIWLIDVGNTSYDGPQPSNFASFGKFNIKIAPGISNVFRKDAATTSEKSTTQIPKEISKQTITSTTTPENKTKATLKSRVKATRENKTTATPKSQVKATPENKTTATPKSQMKATPENKTTETQESKENRETHV